MNREAKFQMIVVAIEDASDLRELSEYKRYVLDADTEPKMLPEWRAERRAAEPMRLTEHTVSWQTYDTVIHSITSGTRDPESVFYFVLVEMGNGATYSGIERSQEKASAEFKRHWMNCKRAAFIDPFGTIIEQWDFRQTV